MADIRYASELEKEFPRLLPRIVELWGYPELEMHMDHLLLDDRGDRKGFPDAIIGELIFLKLLNATRIHSEVAPHDKNLWEEPAFNKTIGHLGPN